MQRAGQYLGYLSLRFVVCIVQALPISLCCYGVRMLATLFCDVLRIRREVTEENLLHAFPEMSDAQRRRLTWRMWEHLFLFAVEVIHSSRKLHPTNCHHYVRFKGEAEAVRALLDERPLVHLTAHFGSFELGSFITALLGYEIYSVARPLDNPYLDRFMS